MGNSWGNLLLGAAESGGAVAHRVRVWVAVLHSVGAGAALRVVMFNHLVSCISPSPSDWKCLVQLEEVWESAGRSL